MISAHQGRWTAALVALLAASGSPAGGEERDLAYVELEGTASGFQAHREWRSYYWRDDFTLILRDDAGQTWRIISREPTPWNNLRLGTTYPQLAVDWARSPRVRVIGVRGVDRTPVEFYGLKLDEPRLATAFLLRVQEQPQGPWRDVYINNWFHRWNPETDRKVLAHYATKDPNYTVYGYLNGIAAPFDAAGQALLKKFEPDYGGVIYHARVVAAKNDVGYELQALHLMGRHKKTLEYQVFHGDPAQLVKLDQRKPQ